MLAAKFLTYFIVIISIVNLVRMTIYLIGGDVYSVLRLRRERAAKALPPYQPTVSLVVPAHNEAAVIDKTLECLVGIDYPKDKLQIVVADDGSTDDTVAVVEAFKKAHADGHEIDIFAQPNGGKADALNNAIAARATGELVMCLDADSLIAPDGVTKAVAYFRDPRVAALASNVNIMDNGTLLGLVQRFEYLISYHMKKAQTIFNIEYIIGGIGSMFRHDMLKRVAFYDTNTMTEDIDLTMKIIGEGNKHHRVVFAADCLTYTEAVPSFRSLVTQRYRWKYGRMQTFYKNAHLFFSRDRRYAKQLTWFILPYALLQEVLFLAEPLIVGYILFVSIYYRDAQTLLMAYGVITAYVLVNVWSTAHLTVRDRLKLSVAGTTMYIFLYALSVVEYMALLRALMNLRHLKESLVSQRTTWVSPERSGTAKRSAV